MLLTSCKRPMNAPASPRKGTWDKLSSTKMTTSASAPALRNIATELRIDSIASTTEAGSGHPTTCMSAAEIVATLFFGEMRFDPKNPQNPDNDRFVLSKGHAAPILYAAWAQAGLFPRADLLNLRKLDSDLEGHPTPRLSFVDVATGSLGQGICAAVGTALNARRIGSDYRTYVLLGDGEMAEGSVWEAADVALYHKLDNLCGIVDVNALGQSRHTQFEHQMDEIAARWNAFGWHTLIVDGHDVEALQHAFAAARAAKNNPTMILAKTIKGKGVASVEGKDGWHGKAFKKGEEADKAIAELRTQLVAGAIESRDSLAGVEAARSDQGRLFEDAGAVVQARRAGRDARSVGHGARRARRRRSRASSRSTPTSRTRPSAIASRRRFPIGSTRTSSPSR